MKIIIPMAGRGSRLRPHTLVTPKPLVKIAGKPMVQRLVESMTSTLKEEVEEIAFIIGDFGEQVEKDLVEVAESVGAKGSVYHQTQPLGTAHAILCAADSLEEKCIIAFADTLFKADFAFDTESDGIIWVERVADPSAFGVVKLNNEGIITDFVEKPQEFVSDMAIVGIYYFKDGDNLKKELQYLLDNDIKDKGEYQLTNALENMKQKGIEFKTGEIEEWLDCGNKEAVVYTNQRILEFNNSKELVDETAQIINSVIRMPCYIGENAIVKNCIIGPHVSIGNDTKVENSVVRNTVIQEHSEVNNALLQDSMIGEHASYNGTIANISIGDYSKV